MALAFALACIIFSTFFDQTVFAMLAERIGESFGLSDTAVGFVLGPAGIVPFVFVGIPLQRVAPNEIRSDCGRRC